MECSGSKVCLRFDRGTLLVTASGMALEGLPFIVWDPRVEAFRAPAFRHRALARAIEDRGFAVDDQIRLLDTLYAEWRSLELRSYQATAVDAWVQSGRRGVVALPTGSGKTRVALAAIQRVALPTLVLVPTIALLDQWCAQLSAFSSGSVGRIGDGVHRVEPITVSTYESAYRQMSGLGDRFGLLVVDEAHHFGAGMRDEALEMCIAAARLGLTGTFPSDPVHRERLERLLGPIVYEQSIAELMGEHLAPLTRNRILVDLAPEERLRYATHLEAFSLSTPRFARTIPALGGRTLFESGAKVWPAVGRFGRGRRSADSSPTTSRSADASSTSSNDTGPVEPWSFVPTTRPPMPSPASIWSCRSPVTSAVRNDGKRSRSLRLANLGVSYQRGC